MVTLCHCWVFAKQAGKTAADEVALIGDLIANAIEKTGDDVLIRISASCLLSLRNLFLCLFLVYAIFSFVCFSTSTIDFLICDYLKIYCNHKHALMLMKYPLDLFFELHKDFELFKYLTTYENFDRRQNCCRMRKMGRTNLSLLTE